MTLRCRWPDCKALRFGSKEDLVAHWNRHLRRLIAFAKCEDIYCCTWPGCNRKIKTFKATNPLYKHLKDHVKDHWCSEPNCSAAFARKSDLDRHIRAKHSKDPSHPCPIETCDRHINGFSRKDHLDQHTRKEHHNFRCGFHHCEAQVLECEMKDHYNSCHGLYECSFPSCESTTSKFTWNSAKLHLRAHHRISYRSSWDLIPSDSGDGTMVVSLPTRSRVRVSPCSICTNSNASSTVTA